MSCHVVSSKPPTDVHGIPYSHTDTHDSQGEQEKKTDAKKETLRRGRREEKRIEISTQHQTTRPQHQRQIYLSVMTNITVPDGLSTIAPL